MSISQLNVYIVITRMIPCNMIIINLTQSGAFIRPVKLNMSPNGHLYNQQYFEIAVHAPSLLLCAFLPFCQPNLITSLLLIARKKLEKNLMLNIYTATIFCFEMSSAFLVWCIYWYLIFFIEVKNVNPDQTDPWEQSDPGSLIWVHIVCISIGYLRT